ncbi:MAG: amidase [Betaproteobacteria bacterium]|nr:amidase [Betaproteobacteria bacterium]
MMHDPARAFMPYPAVPVAAASTGPLTGLRFGVKDLFDVAGYPTSGGQPFVLAMSGIKQNNAQTVQRLLDAGAQFAGKTVTDEFAFSMNGQNAHFGSPINGAAPDRISGGSSSGSAAAVSHALVDFALGTDTGGSVRAPASHCGLVGLRPSHGRVSLLGALDLAPSLDTCGWFTRDLPTFLRIGEVLLGPDAKALPAQPRLLYPKEVWGLLSPEVSAAYAPALDKITRTYGTPQPVEVLNGHSFDALYWGFRYIQGHEAWKTDGALIERFHMPLGPGVAQRFAWSKAVTDDQWNKGLSLRTAYRSFLADLLGDDGMMVMPTMPDVAPLISADESSLEDYRNKAIQMLCIAGLTGFPQLSLPWASRLDAPLGISLFGPSGSDLSLIQRALQSQ